MPYVSDAQRKYFNANRAKMEAQGVDVDEYNEASKGKQLPARAPKKKLKKKKQPSRIAHNSPAAMMLGLKKSPEHPLMRSR